MRSTPRHPWSEPSRARKNAADIAEPRPPPPLRLDPLRKNLGVGGLPLPGDQGGCRFGSTAMTMTNAPSSCRAGTTAAQQTLAPSAAAEPSSFTSVGALFQGREDGEFQLRLEPAFLSTLGYPIHSGQKATLIVKNRQSRQGRPYRSVFLAIEDC